MTADLPILGQKTAVIPGSRSDRSCPSRAPQTLFLKLFPHGDSAASYRSQLEEAHSNLLVTGQRGPGTPGIRLTRPRVEAAARSLGFKPVRHFTLPDGRKLTM